MIQAIVDIRVTVNRIQLAMLENIFNELKIEYSIEPSKNYVDKVMRELEK